MKRSKWILTWCVLCLALLNLGAQAEETKPTKTHKYTLNLIWIVGTTPHQFVWQVDAWPNSAYQSLDSEYLRKRISDLPENSTIEYFVNDALIGGEPSYREAQNFAEFCRNQGILLIIHPGG